MSFVDVFPVEPTTATTRASLFERTRLGERGEGRLLVVGDERRCSPRRRLLHVGDAGVESDEEVAGADDARSRP